RADIGPAAGNRHDRGARGLLHHGIVDRDRARLAEGLRIEGDEAEIAAGLRHRITYLAHAGGIDLAILVEQDVGAEHEVAAVPQIARLDVPACGCGIRLFHEFLDGEDLARNRLAWLDVAVFGGRALRLD